MQPAQLSTLGVAVVHNHWVHYQDLLFAELALRLPKFFVIFAAPTSKTSPTTGNLTLLRYKASILSDKPYENASLIGVALGLWSALRQSNPDVLIVSGWYSLEGWAGWLWARVNRVPIILWAESNHFDKKRVWYKEPIKRYFVKYCRYVHVYGHSSQNYLMRLGFPPGRIVTKRAVFDVDRFTRLHDLTPSAGPMKLLYVGRLAPEKNLQFLIRAFMAFQSKIHGSGVTLTIVGHGPERAELEDLVASLGGKDVIEFRGKVSQSELPAVYSSHDLFILPSTYEPWGLVVAEAMACGLPALVSTQCGCAADLVTKTSGWTFDPYRLESLAIALEAASSESRESIRSRGNAAQALVSDYSPAACADRVLASICRLLDDSVTNRTIQHPS